MTGLLMAKPIEQSIRLLCGKRAAKYGSCPAKRRENAGADGYATGVTESDAVVAEI